MKEKWNMELSEYIIEGEKNRVEKTKDWEIAIGLQEVDGLKPSKYLIETAKEHIEGKITIGEAKKRIDGYYEETSSRKKDENEEEADKVSVRIAELLSENTFTFSPIELSNIHRRLFDGILENAGEYRTYNFTKKEWILNGESVIYSDYINIKENLEYDFSLEKEFIYKDLSMEEVIKHLAVFISNIWQIHPFSEGNTRTIAVFLIKYLNSFGFKLDDELFAQNSWYFRNALVRANYKKFENNIFVDMTYLEKFMYNLLTNTKYSLKNRYMHVDYKKEKEENEVPKYTLEEQVIINLIEKNSTITQEEISLELNKSLRTVKNYMSAMQEKGYIKRLSGRKNGEWIILK